MINYELNYDEKTKKVTKHWQQCVGSGHATLAHRADYMEQLEFVTRELGIKSVRFHGIFNDDMNVCQSVKSIIAMKNKKATKVFDFYQIACIYDRLLAIGVKPFVELSFMPSALAKGKKTIFYYKGNVSMPRYMSEWSLMITKFAEFLVDRYGIDEVSSWCFEVWNEPDLGCFFDGTMTDYFELYKHITVGEGGAKNAVSKGA